MPSKSTKKIKKVVPGDFVTISRKGESLEGIMMPKHEFSEPSSIVLKRSDGYNVGLKLDQSDRVRKVRSYYTSKIEHHKISHDPKKPTISILHTGGTIASRVDYKTGGVVSSFTPEELVELYPELNQMANIKSRLISNIFSEDMRFDHYKKIARAAYEEILSGSDGIIITHGTDTLHYSSCAISFMLNNLPIPVIFVGAQRSSDRGSSDAFLNMVSAARFIIESDFSGVAICMHENLDDKSCIILPACRSRKLHSSRRDAFKAVDANPIAIIGDKIEFLSDYSKRDMSRKVEIMDRMDERVALIKIHPNISPKIIQSLKGFRGLVLEGTGLGHAPISHGNEKFFEAVKKISKSTIIAMTSQTIYGNVNMNVYSTGRIYQKIGVIPCNMTSESSLIKISWLLGNFPKVSYDEIRRLMLENLRGEICN